MSCIFLGWVTGEQGQALSLCFPISNSGTTLPALQASLNAKGTGCNVPVNSQCSIGDSLTMILFPLSKLSSRKAKERLLRGALYPRAPNTRDNHECCPPLRPWMWTQGALAANSGLSAHAGQALTYRACICPLATRVKVPLTDCYKVMYIETRV